MEHLSRRDIEAIRTQRHAFQALASTDTGLSLIAWVLDACAYFSMDPADIVPEKIVLANKLLGVLGVNHPANKLELTRAIMGAANENDLVAEEKWLKEQEDGQRG